MRILLSLLSYGKLTGSELYVYELARELLALGHTIGIAATSLDRESELVARLQHENLEYYQLADAPNTWDIVHCSQTQVAEMCKLLFRCPIIQTIHSEVLSKYESPVDGLAHYVAVRPKIYESLLEKYPSDKVTLIYNGVDKKRFTKFTPEHKAIIFPGTVNYLRKKAFQDVAKYMNDGYKIIYIGEGWPIEGSRGNAYFMKPRWEMESIYRMGSMTASIMLGRTTIEGWLMGLPGIIYEINDSGEIINKKVRDPLPSLERYYSDNMAKDMVKLYERYFNNLPH